MKGRMYTDKISGILTRKELCIDATEEWSRSQHLTPGDARVVTSALTSTMSLRLTAFALAQTWSREAAVRRN